MRFFKKSNTYKNSTGTNKLNMTTLVATSYDWWVYVKVFDSLVVFNSHPYSITTRKHQREMRGLLRNLNIKIDFEVRAPKGLDNLNNALEHAKTEVELCSINANKPRIREATKVRYRELVSYWNEQVVIIQSLMGVE